MTSAGWYDAGRKSGVRRGGSPACTSRCLPTARCASLQAQTRRFQDLRRSHHRAHPRQPRRSGRAQWLRQVEHHRRRALGAGRDARVRVARRVDAGRDLQRLDHAQAGVARECRAGLRQRRGQGRRAVVALCRDLGEACARPLGRVDLLHQQRPCPPQGRDRPLPGHRSGSARLRDHRAGHDLAHHRGAPGRDPWLPGGGRGRHQVPRAAQGDRGSAARRARQPRPPRRHPHGARRAHRAPRGAGRGGGALPRARRGARREAAALVAGQAQRGARRAGARGGLLERGEQPHRGRQRPPAGARDQRGVAARRALRGIRSGARGAERPVRGERRGRTPGDRAAASRRGAQAAGGAPGAARTRPRALVLAPRDARRRPRALAGTRRERSAARRARRGPPPGDRRPPA